MKNPGAFFDYIRDAIFDGSMLQSQVDGINAILATWDHAWGVLNRDADQRYVAYTLATTYWETAHTMQPIEEYGHGRGHAYGLPAGPWHQVYDGRGDVQMTWYANYRFATDRLRQLMMLSPTDDLARTPALALRPDIAASVLIFGMVEGWFTRKKLVDYFTADDADWINAREIVNGVDHAHDIATIAIHFWLALKAGEANDDA